MSEGFFIGLGDKTSCGGEVLDGDPRINLYGLLHACEGDRVTCGVNGKTYRIEGGISHMESHGRLMAGTLDSRSSCPCKATLTPSVYTARYVKQPSAAQPMRRAAEQDAASLGAVLDRAIHLYEQASDVLGALGAYAFTRDLHTAHRLGEAIERLTGWENQLLPDGT